MVKRKSKKPTKDNNDDGGGGFSLPIFTPPPSGLVPVGDSGFYTTPDEPADVLDCERYPGSIFCADEFPVVPFSFQPSIVINECNIGIQIDAVISFANIPPVAIVYRKKECRYPPPIQEQPEIEYEADFYEPVKFINPQCSQGVLGSYSRSFTSYQEFIKKSNQFEYISKETSFVNASVEILEFDFPNKVPYGQNQIGIAYLHVKYRVIINTQLNVPVPEYDSDPSIPVVGNPTSFTNDFIEEGWIRSSNLEINDTGSTIFFTIDFAYGVGIFPVTELRFLNYGGIYIQGFSGGNVQPVLDLRNFQVSALTTFPGRDNDRFVMWRHINTPICACEVQKTPPPVPLFNKPKEDMACCPEHTNLLRQLIAKVNKLSKVVGVEDYPVSLPTSLISKDEGFLGNLIPNLNEDVPSLTRFLAWYVKRFDEIMGQWEIAIQVKDTDPSQPGDQPVGIKLPNLAESIAEMFTLAFQTNINTETLLNASIRTLAETAADKQQNFITYKLLQSLTDWVGFKQKDLALKMPLLMTLEKTRYDEILQESEVEVGCVEFDEKFGLEADLIKLREGVAILQAQHKVKLNPSTDLKTQILAHLLETFRGVNKVNGDSEDDDADFAKFLEDVETGFINTPGANQTTDPYDKPFNRRPKIRDLSKLEPPTTP